MKTKEGWNEATEINAKTIIEIFVSTTKYIFLAPLSLRRIAQSGLYPPRGVLILNHPGSFAYKMTSGSFSRLSAKFLPLFMINSTFVKSILTQLKKLLKWAQ